MLSPDSWIVCRLADRAANTVCRRVIRQLQSIPNESTRDYLPHLRTCWDEVCIQVQGEESIHWNAYLAEVDLRVRGELGRLPQLEREALWMQTDAGRDWEFDDERDDVNPPVSDEDVIDYVRAKLLQIAADWTNPALRAQQDVDGRKYLEENR